MDENFKDTISKPIVLASAIIGLISIILGATLWSGIGVTLVAYAVGLLIRDANTYFMPFELMIIVMSGIQWIVAPVICYLFGSIMFGMSVHESQYMIYTLCLYLPLYIAMLIYHNKRKINDLNIICDYCKYNLKLIKLFIAIGLIALFIPSISFFVTLLSILYYIGIVMLMLYDQNKSLSILIVGMMPLVAKSLSSAMFHDLLLWGMLLLLTFFFIKKYTLAKRVGIFVGLFILVVLLQTIKAQYRAAVWSETSGTGSNVELFTNLMVNSASKTGISHNLLSMNDRFNQGWIISRIYYHIPSETDYKGGKTIIEGIQTAILPRFMSSSRKNKGEDSRKDFIDFTGVYINNNTSMGLSVIGEAYGNFGIYGGIIFMIVWAFLISSLFKLIDRLGSNNLLWMCLLPMICFTLIKAETNFLSVINWTVKAFIFAYMVVCFSRHFKLITLLENDEPNL